MLSIQGGYWDGAPLPRVAQEHLYLALHRLGHRGAVRLDLRLAQPCGTATSAAASFAIEYAHIDQLARGLTSLLAGHASHVTLEHLAIAG